MHHLPPTPPPSTPPAVLTPEERDALWFRTVYQGNNQRQLTWRAVVTGGLLGMLLSLSNLYTTLKLGWSFGVAITACVMSYVLWNALRALTGGRLSQMSLLENNCMQSTASAAGYSTGGTVGCAFAALFMIEGGHQPWWVVGGMVFFTAALGVFLAIPMKRQMINHEQLPFPSGIAAAETLRSLYTEGKEALSKAYALLAGMAVGGVIALLKGLELLETTFKTNVVGRAAGALRSLVSLPELVPLPQPTIATGVKLGGLGFEPSVLMIGAGMIVGLRTSVSMLLGSVILYYVLSPMLVTADVAHTADLGYHFSIWKAGAAELTPRRWGVWGGTALMVFASLTSFAMQWRTLVRALTTKTSNSDEAVEMARIEVPSLWLWMGLVPITIGLVTVMNLAFHVSIPLGLLAVAMSFVLSLVACRATGETDTTPIGAMGKVTQLVYAMVAHNNLPINLMSAGTTAAAAGSAADLLTDLKSGYLLGANPRKQFLAQFAGVLFGTLIIVPAWYALAPDVETLTKNFPMPAASAWRAMAELLASGISSLPESATWAVVVGSILGIGLPLAETFAPRSRAFLPSAMGLGLGMIVDFSNSFGFLIGSLIAWIWVKSSAAKAETYNIPLASGFVAGESLIAAIIAIVCAAAGLMATVK
ncbi:MAG: Oligopeptide transporter, family [Verrucomicrobiaceae bacterium]|nr:Oligopeptide transporter, family [Verrucomicrobiaceae bacterium]